MGSKGTRTLRLILLQGHIGDLHLPPPPVPAAVSSALSVLAALLFAVVLLVAPTMRHVERSGSAARPVVLGQLTGAQHAPSFTSAASAQAAEHDASLQLARDGFTAFVRDWRQELQDRWKDRLRSAGVQEWGIVTAAGPAALLANAFVNVHVLRHTLHCSLPATVMYWGRAAADRPSPATQEFMQRHIPGLSFVDASMLPYPAWHRPLDGLDGKGFSGWKLKAFVLYAAPYRHVLYLDSDVMPVLNPEPLLSHPLYQLYGSMFWPDIWCGDTCLKLFAKLRVPGLGRNERQTESGIVLLDRTRHWLALEWALWLNAHDDLVYKLAYGDKDTFRAAFFLADELPSFYQVQHATGLMLHAAPDGSAFQTRGFLQAHPNGSAMFVHRAAPDSKLDPASDDPKNISHLTLPSCAYFLKRGFNDRPIPRKHVRGEIYSAARPDVCPFSLHGLHLAAQRCAAYDPDGAGGREALPLFEIPPESYVSQCLAASDAAFSLLRQAKLNNTALF